MQLNDWRRMNVHKKRWLQNLASTNQRRVTKWTSEEQMVKIKNAYENNIIGTRKKLRSSVFEDLEITVHEWFKQHRALSMTL